MYYFLTSMLVVCLNIDDIQKNINSLITLAYTFNKNKKVPLWRIRLSLKM